MNRGSSKVCEGPGDFGDEGTVTPNEAHAVRRLLEEPTEKAAENTKTDLRVHIQGDVVTSATGLVLPVEEDGSFKMDIGRDQTLSDRVR